jgi:hypothetical protein
MEKKLDPGVLRPYAAPKVMRLGDIVPGCGKDSCSDGSGASVVCDGHGSGIW